jgi:3-hydroxy-D-aspartate aldolase
MKKTGTEYIREGIGIGISAPLILASGSSAAFAAAEIEKQLRSGQALRGIQKQQLPTPSLLIDLDRLESNIAKMARHARESSINLRPHAKTHKCSEIARRQMKAGALGICTATIREAEAMARAGIGGLLITAEMVGISKIERLVRLTREQPDTMSVCDNPQHAEQLSEAAVAANVQLNVLVDIDPIGRRTGIAPGVPALNLAKKIDGLPGLRLRGVHCYSGASSHVQGYSDRKAHSERVMGPPMETVAAMKSSGLPVEFVTGGCTGTYNIDPGISGMTELQTGSYVFMDVEYRRIGGKGGEIYDDFQPSLTVLTTVISKSYPDRATIDAGIKAFATDRQFGPELVGVEGVTYGFGGDEHGILTLNNPSREIRLGDHIELLIPHCDPNVNLYDRAYCVRGDEVVEAWKIDARGHL